ncbi:MAG: hypothetical protein ACRD2O_11730, partial [Terriglobia bacterium]
LGRSSQSFALRQPPTYSSWLTSNQQIVYVSSVRTQGNGAPNFLFLVYRSPSAHAAVSGACE